MSLIVNEKRLPATVKRLFKNSISEIVGELLQNSQRAGASEIHFHLDGEANAITIRDDGSGVAPDRTSWSRILRMADSFYADEKVEANQKPMGVGLLSLFALDGVNSVSISSRGKCATIETNLLWESEDYWATWTDLIADTPDAISGFELVIKYVEPDATFSYNRIAHKFEYALTQSGDGNAFAPPRGYDGFLKIFLDGKAVDTSIPTQCIPTGNGLLHDGFYENNRLRIGQSANSYRSNAFVVWYGQIIKLNSEIHFLLEVTGGNPVTPLAPTRFSLVDDQKLSDLCRFVVDAVFDALANENAARKIKPAFVKRLYAAYPARARKELPVCVVREVSHPPDRIIESYADYCDLGTEKVLPYREIEAKKIEIFEPGVSVLTSALHRLPNHFGFSPNLPPSAERTEADEENSVAENPIDMWTETGEGAESFAPQVGGAIRFLVAGNSEKLPLKKIYWKPGAPLRSIFTRAGEFAAVAVDADPVESDFRALTEPVFVFEYTGNFDIEEIEGLCIGLPVTDESDLLNEAARWLSDYAKACYSPDDDYDYDTQESNFNDSISRLILDLSGDVLSTNWSFHELKTLVGKIIAANACANRNHADIQITGIEFLSGNEEAKMIVRLANDSEIALKIASHTYLN